MFNIFRKLDEKLGVYLPTKKIYYTILVVYISIATNDIHLPATSFIMQHYPMHLLIIFVLSFLSIDLKATKNLFRSKVLSAFIVTFIFYMLTRPHDYDIFSADFYKKFGFYPAT
jgi:hypothetical protein